MKPNYLYLTYIFLFFSYVLHSSNILEAHRLSGEVNFDGKVEESAWNAVTPLPLKMQIPLFGEEPTEKSEVFLAYDDNYLYLAGRMYLSDPAYYRPTTFKRDVFDGTTDYFGFVIDSYNDKENGLAFFTTPTGLRWDGVVWNDAQAPVGEAPMTTDWNTFWDAAVSKTDYGWSAEIRIPWTSLRFQDDNGKVLMGITMWWYIAAKNEVDMFPLIPLNWGDWSGWKPSQMQEYHFEGIYAKKPIYFAPYVLGGFQHSFELNDDETAYLEDKKPTYEAGFDLKYSLTSNLTLDVTANTDFAQVEADDQQVNLTRFSLFFPEKRLFFQERASIFDFNFEQFNRLFYSRRVGIDEDGNPVRIYGGARMVGRVGKFDLGFLNMQTAASKDLNAENFGLLRLRRQVINQNSYIGTILTNRTDFEGNHNTSYGLDGIFRVFGDEYLTTKWVQSFEDSLDNELLSLNPSRIFVNWERRRFDGLSYSLTFSRAGEDYAPSIGFELREDFTSLSSRIGYGWLFKDESKLLNMQLFLEGTRLENNTTDTVETANTNIGLFGSSKTGWNFGGLGTYNHEYVPEAFDLSDEAGIVSGEYDFIQAQGFIGTPFQNFFGVFADFTVGGFYDGNLISFGLSPRLKLNAHWQLEGFYQFNRARFSGRDLTFLSHVGRLKVSYLLDTKLSVAAFLQYNSVEEVFSGNMRLRYNPKEGNDLYIVFNDVLNGNRMREIPHLPKSSNRAIVVKYTYTFQW